MSLALTPATEERLQRELETGNFRGPDALLNRLPNCHTRSSQTHLSG